MIDSDSECICMVNHTTEKYEKSIKELEQTISEKDDIIHKLRKEA